jgi:hypothetical protein
MISSIYHASAVISLPDTISTPPHELFRDTIAHSHAGAAGFQIIPPQMIDFEPDALTHLVSASYALLHWPTACASRDEQRMPFTQRPPLQRCDVRAIC